jgi:hypothetical protein
MAIYVGTAIAVIMFAFMLGMYKSKAANIAIFVSAAIVFAGALFLVRSQETVGGCCLQEGDDPAPLHRDPYERAAEINDPRVRQLADGIIAAQVREIDEMKRPHRRSRSQSDPVSASEPRRGSLGFDASAQRSPVRRGNDRPR